MRCPYRRWESLCGSSPRRVDACRSWSFRHLDEHILAFHAHGVGLGRDDRGQAGHLAGDEVEARAVLRALDIHAPQLALAQRELLVRADDAECVEVAVLRMRAAPGSE